MRSAQSRWNIYTKKTFNGCAGLKKIQSSFNFRLKIWGNLLLIDPKIFGPDIWLSGDLKSNVWLHPYSVNLDVFSIAIEFLTTNDLDSGR